MGFDTKVGKSWIGIYLFVYVYEFMYVLICCLHMAGQEFILFGVLLKHLFLVGIIGCKIMISRSLLGCI